MSDPSLVFGLGGAGARSLVFGLLGVPNRECVLPIPLGGEDSKAEVGVLVLVFEADIGTWEAARNYRKINLSWSK